MSATSRILFAFAALLTPAIGGGMRARTFLAREPAPVPAASLPAGLSPPAHDPRKPTVAVVLAADITEITDALGPYEMFARAGDFNVYAVAATTRSVELTGGLRMWPHYSFEGLDRLLEGAAPDIVVAPNLPHIKRPQNRPVVDWVRRSADAGATSFSWCAGAAVLAEAGLLDGRTATSHWGDLARLERDYPRVRWVRGTRWIDHGDIVMSAGITSGIDATLRVLTRVSGESVARRVATEMRYPNFHFALDPTAEQYQPEAADAVLLLNAAFELPRAAIGLALYEGVGELDLSALYDAHAAAAVADVRAVAETSSPIRTAFGLWLEPALVPGRDDQALAALNRLIVPGADARRLAAAVVARATGTRPTLRPEYLQADSPERFSLEPSIEDLARSADRATATFALRRLEYRSSTVHLEGRSFRLSTLGVALLLSTAGLLAATGAAVLRRRPMPSGAGRTAREPLTGDSPVGAS